jgi:pyruvate/2-oxoglutarate dehydrogenase complex dihydrolipoamide acyltransferase (E2) component
MAAASAAVCRERDTIHTVTEVDVSVPRRLIREHADRTGERPSLTAYVVACLARVIRDNPEFNALVTRGRLITLDDVTVGVLVERTIAGERVPEPLAIHSADSMTVSQLTARLREAQEADDDRLGGLSGATWVRFIPSFLFRSMIRVASRSVRMAQHYGVVTVTSVGMFADGAMWLLPLSASTVALSVGGIVERPAVTDDGIRGVEHLCLTLSFDHDIIDGAPAARFTRQLAELIASGALLQLHAGGASNEGIEQNTSR